ncbi:MAG: ISAs1 family transposase [Candidatus Thorarchaeota archaeon]|nr:ISAs1 family transposase [Candidatus Thorarchaeota archaeon]
MSYIICIVLLGFIKGKVSIESCVRFTTVRKRWFARWFDMDHGVPNATTISRALSVTKPQDIIKSVNRFMLHLEGVVIEAGLSLDGKTIRAISELKNECKHFLSLFSHTTCRILDQEGVYTKENEIPATPRLLSRHTLMGSMITGDALLTQTNITQAIKESGGDYLLMVKGNQSGLQDILKTTFKDPLAKTDCDIFHRYRKTRSIETTITITKDLDLQDLNDQGWEDIALVGKLERTGVRIHKGNPKHINETIYFITSRASLTSKEAYQFIRNHWHIENKLHWQKDITWKEDRQRSTTGNTPDILSYLRSLALSLIRQKYISVTRAIDTFTEQPSQYLNLLTQLSLV